jgi:hypothetical protein
MTHDNPFNSSLSCDLIRHRSAARGGLSGAALSVCVVGPGVQQAGVGQSDTVTNRATVQSVNPATRGITLVGPAGNKMGQTHMWTAPSSQGVLQ